MFISKKHLSRRTFLRGAGVITYDLFLSRSKRTVNRDNEVNMVMEPDDPYFIFEYEVENPFGDEIKSISLDRFDSIDVVVEPGQAWYKAGDLVFRLGPVETFRIAAVPRPETFRQTCLKANMSFVGVKKLRELGAAV